jgi:DNA-binding response OmpR family regulator
MSENGLALVIEDDFDASVIFAKAFEVLDFKTEVIVSGNDAVERLKEVVPEIILLDLHLPGVLGTNILRSIRADERLKETLVIVATADPRSADLIQDMADLVLIKPTTFSQVRDLAARLTAPRRRKQEAEEKAKEAKVTEETGGKPAGESPAGKVEAKEEKVSEPAAEKAGAKEEKANEPAVENPAEKTEEKPETPSPPPGTEPGQS